MYVSALFISSEPISAFILYLAMNDSRRMIQFLTAHDHDGEDEQ